MAAVFLVAIWAIPSKPSPYPVAAFAVLAAYFAASALYLAVTWSNWWLEYRIGRVAHAADIFLFGIMVYLTEGYTSPFYTFFVFLILSATIRWSWKETAGTAVVVILLFVVTGLQATRWNAADVQVTSIVIRGTYLVILSLLLIWFSLNGRRGFFQDAGGGAGVADDGDFAPTVEPPVRTGLEHAVARTKAARAALVWWDENEPWVDLAMLAGGEFSERRFSPDAFGDFVDDRLAGRTFLFDAARNHVLAEGGTEPEPIPGIDEPLDPRLRAEIACDEGLVVSVETETHGALFVLAGIPGLCSDDLAVGKGVGEDFSRALRQSSMLLMFQSAAANRTRLAISRDLHDTIVQLLAGTSLRLQGIRRSIAAGRDVDEDLKSLQDGLRIEQQGLRMLIGDLRSSAASEKKVMLGEGLMRALKQAARQWGIKAELEDYPGNARLGQRLGHEINQFVREAIANAVKHGRATEVALDASIADRRLTLAIRDNGHGFPGVEGATSAPRSIDERSRALGGDVSVESTPEGATVTLRLPWGDKQ
jgi:signal transduction histidine kinase